MTASDLLQALEKFTSSLGVKLSQYREEKLRSDLTHASDFNVFDHINPDENGLSDILVALLKPNGEHGQGMAFLQLFLETTELGDLNLSSRVRIDREVRTNFILRPRRIDFTIEVDTLAIGVENKPWPCSKDQPDQVRDYVQHLRNKYGDDGFRLVYLSSDGSDPESLDLNEREALVERNQFRVISYTKGIRDWLTACVRVCQAEHVGFFLQDFKAYIERQITAVGGSAFGGIAMGRHKAEEKKVVLDFVQSEEVNLRVAFSVLEYAKDLRDDLVKTFTADLVQELQRKLGDGWETDNSISEGINAGKKMWEVLSFWRKDWKEPDSKDPVRIVLAYDDGMPGKVDFTVRRGDELHDDADPTGVANLLASALDERCGRGDRKGKWWPHWYQKSEQYPDWSDPDTLLELWKKNAAFDYFIGHFLGMAEAVDSVLGENNRRSGRVE